MVIGGGSGLFDTDNTGSKPNPDAETIVVDFRLFDEVFEPILLGVEIRTPLKIDIPEFEDLFEGALEEISKKLEKELDEVAPVLLPETTKPSDLCPSCTYWMDSSHVNQQVRERNQREIETKQKEQKKKEEAKKKGENEKLK